MVYLAMLEHPADGVSALAEQVGVSETVVKESQDELAMISLLKPSAEYPGVLGPFAPEIGSRGAPRASAGRTAQAGST